ICKANGDRTRTLNLEAIVIRRMRVQSLRSKARAGVIDLNQAQVAPARIFDGRFNKSRAASRQRKQGDNQSSAERSAPGHTRGLRCRMRAVKTTPVSRLCSVIGKAT